MSCFLRADLGMSYAWSCVSGYFVGVFASLALLVRFCEFPNIEEPCFGDIVSNLLVFFTRSPAEAVRGVSCSLLKIAV